MRRAHLIPTFALCAALAGCDLAPHYIRPAAPVPQAWPQGAAYGAQPAGTPDLPWRQVFASPKLRQVIELALADNRDLRASVASLAAARAQYHVERSYQLPTLTAGASASVTRGGTNSALDTQSYDANLGVSSFEVDLFGRLKNQTREAFETYLPSASRARTTRFTIVTEPANDYATLASDRDLLRIAQETVASGQGTLALTQRLFDAGLDNAADVQEAITVVEQARSDVQNDTTQVAQDRNALDLLVGAPVPDDLLPAGLDELDGAVGNIPAGLSSDVLQQRPDVVEAEHNLRSEYAAIGAARAAFFPTLSLTSSLGVASSALSSLFTGGAVSWSATPSVSVPVLGGTNRGNLQYARAERDYYLAEYEKAVQTAFRDVANGLARRGTIVAQRQAQTRLVAAAARSLELSDVQLRAGTSDYVTVLTNQRTLYAAQQTQVSTILTDVANRITLYEAVGADPSLDLPAAAPAGS